MQTATCGECGDVRDLPDHDCVVEIDERRAGQVRDLLSGAAAPECGACGEVLLWRPAVVVWVEDTHRALVARGGPWVGEGPGGQDWSAALGCDVYEYESEAALCDAVVERLLTSRDRWSDVSSLAEDLEEVTRWIQSHRGDFNWWSVAVAALLDSEGLLSGGEPRPLKTEAEGEADEQRLGEVMAMALVDVALQYRFEESLGERLDDRIDSYLQPTSVPPSTASHLARVLGDPGGLDHPVVVALECLHAWVCWCAQIDNDRSVELARSVFELELFATGAGGELPLVAHAVRLSRHRLDSVLEREALKSAIAQAPTQAREETIETARRLGYPDLADHLITVRTPDWLKELGPFTALASHKETGEPLYIREGSGLQDIQTTFLRERPAERSDAVDDEIDAQVDVFISYSSRDRIKAEAICAYLEATGLQVFLDKRTPAGELWLDRIASELHSARSVLVLWSRHALSSKWVLQEAEVALDRGVLFQALLAPVVLSPRFSPTQAAKLETWSGDHPHDELARLATAINERLGLVGDGASDLALSTEIDEQLARLEVAEAVLVLCSGRAWSAIGGSKELWQADVERGYATLERALAPASPEDIHDLIEAFDLSRVLLLRTLTTADRRTGAPTVELGKPFRCWQENSAEWVIECNDAFVNRALFVSELLTQPGSVAVELNSPADADADGIALPDGPLVVIAPSGVEANRVGRVSLRGVS